MTLRDVIGALDAGSGDVADVALTGVSIDSRTTRPGDLFFAIRGERFDGHDFVKRAFEAGAAASVVSREPSDGEGGGAVGGALVVVDDTLDALQELARWYRSRLDLTVVAITGTNGKTTTKDMAAAVLATRFCTARTEGNLNNHIGVPLTLLSLGAEHEAAVVEMGMNHPGEIEKLARIADPSVGVITNVAEGHLESMGSLDAVADAKGELLDALPPDGRAVLNADDPLVMGQAGRSRAPVLTFGLSESSAVRAVRVAESGTGGATGVEFDLAGGGTVRLPVPGRHNVRNALAALAVGEVLGVELAPAIRALASFAASPMRMGVMRVGDHVVLNDTYNSNPGSLAAALETLVSVAAGRATVAVLGDMLELGAGSADAHRDAGSKAAAIGVERLMLFGEEVVHMRDGAVEGGMSPEAVAVYEDKQTLARELEELPERDAVILVKGSRGMRMEEVVELLVREAPAS